MSWRRQNCEWRPGAQHATARSSKEEEKWERTVAVTMEMKWLKGFGVYIESKFEKLTSLPE